jgi:hypothetical protein
LRFFRAQIKILYHIISKKATPVKNGGFFEAFCCRKKENFFFFENEKNGKKILSVLIKYSFFEEISSRFY